MPIKNRSTPESAAFWDFVEETARQVREESPAWARDVVAADRGDDDESSLMCVSSGTDPRAVSDPSRD